MTNRYSLLPSALVVVAVLFLLPCRALAQGLASTRLNGPDYIVLDDKGNLYVYEFFGHKVLYLDFKADRATVVAGTGEDCCFTEGAAATSVAITGVNSIALDREGNVLLAGRNRPDGGFVRKVDRATGRITTLANSTSTASAASPSGKAGPPTVTNASAALSDPRGMAVLPDDKLLVSAEKANMIVELVPSECFVGPAKPATGNATGPSCAATADLHAPGALAVDADGDVFVADFAHQRVLRIDAKTKAVTTYAGNGGTVVAGEGVPATQAAVPLPNALTLDREGNLYVVSNGDGRVRKIDAKTGIITTVAGTGHIGYGGDNGPAIAAHMVPAGIAVDAAGNLYIADAASARIRMVDKATGIIKTVAGVGKSKDLD